MHSGAHSSLSIWCVLSGPLGLIVASVLQISVSASSSHLEADGLPGGYSVISSSKMSLS